MKELLRQATYNSRRRENYLMERRIHEWPTCTNHGGPLTLLEGKWVCLVCEEKKKGGKNDRDTSLINPPTE